MTENYAGIFIGLCFLTLFCYEQEWEQAFTISLIATGFLPPFFMLAGRLWRGVVTGAVLGWSVTTAFSLMLILGSTPTFSLELRDGLNAGWLGLCLGVPLGANCGGMLESRRRKKKRRQ